MMAAAAIKFLGTKSIAHMKFQISQQQNVNSEAKGRLKGLENKKKVIENNRDLLLAKKSKLSKRLDALTADLEPLEQEEAERQHGDEEQE